MNPALRVDASRENKPSKTTIEAILARVSCELIRTQHHDQPARYYVDRQRISAATYHLLSSLADLLECFWTRSRRAKDGSTCFRHGLTARFHPRHGGPSSAPNPTAD